MRNKRRPNGSLQSEILATFLIFMWLNCFHGCILSKIDLLIDVQNTNDQGLSESFRNITPPHIISK